MNVKNKYNKGFTMVEMLTVATIIVILIAAAIPGWRNFVQNNQAATIASRIHAALTLARTNAIQSGERISLCPAVLPLVACVTTNPSPAIWAWDTWILFMDKNTNNFIDTGETLKTYYDQQAGIITANSKLLYFDAAGFANANTVFNILPPGCVGNNGRSVTINRNGNIQVDAINCP